MKYQIFNSYHLKIIALASMVLDHLGILFFPDIYILRIVGRIAFVLYAFMLVEGYFYTKNYKKYISKIFIWSLISEIPFDLAFYNKWFYFETQNIFFTLLLGLICLKLIDSTKQIFLKFIVILLIILLAIVFRVDYSWYGVTLIVSFHFFRNNDIFKFTFAQVLSMFASLKILFFQMFAFLGLIPIAMYNGKKGKIIGDIYYSFYAIHITVLLIIKYFIKM